jgi:hypothetical protein
MLLTTHTPILGYALQLLFYKDFCKFLPGEVFSGSGGQPEARFYFRHMRKPFPGHDLQLFQISLKLIQWFGFLHTHRHTQTQTHTDTHTHADKH